MKLYMMMNVMCSENENSDVILSSSSYPHFKAITWSVWFSGRGWTLWGRCMIEQLIFPAAPWRTVTMPWPAVIPSMIASPGSALSGGRYRCVCVCVCMPCFSPFRDTAAELLLSSWYTAVLDWVTLCLPELTENFRKSI